MNTLLNFLEPMNSVQLQSWKSESIKSLKPIVKLIIEGCLNSNQDELKPLLLVWTTLHFLRWFLQDTNKYFLLITLEGENVCIIFNLWWNKSNSYQYKNVSICWWNGYKKQASKEEGDLLVSWGSETVSIYANNLKLPLNSTYSMLQEDLFIQSLKVVILTFNIKHENNMGHLFNILRRITSDLASLKEWKTLHSFFLT